MSLNIKMLILCTTLIFSCSANADTMFSELQLKQAYVDGYCDGILKVAEMIKEPTPDIQFKIQDCEYLQKYHVCINTHKEITQCESIVFKFSEPLSLFKIKQLYFLQ